MDQTWEGGIRRRAWGDAARPVVEEWTIAGMVHGYPIEAGRPSDRLVIAAGIDATAEIARFWGLSD